MEKYDVKEASNEPHAIVSGLVGVMLAHVEPGIHTRGGSSSEAHAWLITPRSQLRHTNSRKDSAGSIRLSPPQSKALGFRSKTAPTRFQTRLLDGKLNNFSYSLHLSRSITITDDPRRTGATFNRRCRTGRTGHFVSNAEIDGNHRLIAGDHHIGNAFGAPQRRFRIGAAWY